MKNKAIPRTLAVGTLILLIGVGLPAAPGAAYTCPETSFYVPPDAVSVQAPEGIVDCVEGIVGDALDPLERPVANITGWVSGAICTGTVVILDEAVPEVAADLLSSDSLTSEEPQAIPPALGIAILALILAAIGTGYALRADAIAKANQAKDPYAEWSYECSVASHGLQANGESGVLRRISILIDSADQPTEVGTSCSYDGVQEETCANPAEYRNDVVQPAGAKKGTSDVYKTDQGEWVYDPPLPTTGQACITPSAKARNAFQLDRTGVIVEYVEKPLEGEICAAACIEWTGDELGCRPSD